MTQILAETVGWLTQGEVAEETQSLPVFADVTRLVRQLSVPSTVKSVNNNNNNNNNNQEKTQFTIIDFEDDSIGETSKYSSTKGYANDVLVSGNVSIVADPVNASKKSLSFASTADYNQASVIPIFLPYPLSDYESVTFRTYGISGDIDFKNILLYISDNKAKFLDGGFGNDANSPYAKFVELFIGQSEEVSLTNTWTEITIEIGSLDNAVKNLEGNAYIALGINSEIANYLLDDINFVLGENNNIPQTGTKIDFENGVIGSPGPYLSTKGGSGSPSPGTVIVDADPSNSAQKSLKYTSVTYNQAPIIPITLPSALSNYKSISFRMYGETGDLNNKNIYFYISDTAEKFKEYSFGNPSSDSNNFANLLAGQVTHSTAVPVSVTTGVWTEFAFDINPDAAVSGITNAFIAMGINCNGATYYIDDIEFKTEAYVPPPNATVSPGSITFYKAAPENIVINLTLQGGCTFTNIIDGSTPLSQSYYSASAATVTIYSSYLQTLADKTTKKLAFVFSNDITREISIKIEPLSVDPARMVKVDFENDTIGRAYKSTRGGNPPAEAAVNVTQDPTASSEKSLKIDTGSGTNQWNKGAIIHFNIPQPLSLYDTFTFRFYLQSGTSNNTAESRSIDVYAHNAETSFPDHNFGNDSSQWYKDRLIGKTTPVNFSKTGEWIEYEITRSETTNIIASLQGEIYIAIGINNGTNLVYYIDDLTFHIGEGIVIPASISPHSTTYFLNNNSDIDVNMTLNGRTLSAIKNGSTPLSKGTDYTENGNSVTIKQAYIDGYSSSSSITLTFEFDDGPSSELTIKITDISYDPARAVKIDFETEIAGITNVGGATVSRTADPKNGSQFSLKVNHNAYNRAAVIPINLYDIKNYQYVLLKLYLESGSSINPVMIFANTTNSFNTGGFGNILNNQYFSPWYSARFVGQSENITGMPTGQWVDYIIPIDIPNSSVTITQAGSNNGTHTLGSISQDMKGNLFLAIGVNNDSPITYYIDDIIFVLKDDFVIPENSTINPAAANFDRDNPTDVSVTMDLKGNTLSDIQIGGSALSATNYSVSGAAVTIKKEYLATLGNGARTFTFNFSGGLSQTLTVTITGIVNIITEWDFSTTSINTSTITSSGNGTFAFTYNTTEGVLEVQKTNANHSTPIFEIPFNLGTANLNSFTKVIIELKGVTGDYTNKNFQVVSGTTQIGNIASGLGTAFKTLTINLSSIPSATGEIKLGFRFDNTQGYTIQIKSIKLE